LLALNAPLASHGTPIVLARKEVQPLHNVLEALQALQIQVAKPPMPKLHKVFMG
jgi:hypothetical protein